MINTRTRQHLSTDALLRIVKEEFDTIETPKRSEFSTTDCLMSALAIYGMKAPSLLKFMERMQDEIYAGNVKKLFDINKIPSDTRMRERLDEISPSLIRKSFKKIFAQAQRGRVLEQFKYLDDYYLFPIDGTGFFSSDTIHCDYCCTKNHQNGTTTYHHQALGTTLVHPDLPYVIPLMLEFICKKDGDTKNDCELNAAGRLLEDMRREHPHLKIMVVEDALYANGPHIQQLQELDMRYIIVAKKTNHAYLFDWVKDCEKTTHRYCENNVMHEFEFVNDVPLNDTYHDLRVNFLHYTQTDKKGVRTTWTWITNVFITIENVYHIMKGGRARWRIENNTFNTLKNQGYNFEHNFGHGYKHLSNTMASLMLLIFMIDQLQLLTSALFQTAKKLMGSYASLWEEMRVIIRHFVFDSWEALLHQIVYKEKRFPYAVPP